jgi:hypothetical protein
VRYCLELGANVNASSSRWTMLHYTVSVYVARMLLDAGAVVDSSTTSGWTPLYRAVRNNCKDIARLLIDRGARVSNIKLSESFPVVPDWVSVFVASRMQCRFAAITIIGIHKYRRTHVTGKNDMNVLKLISKHIWSTRMDDVWVTRVKPN